MEFKEAVTRNLRRSEGLGKFSGRAGRAEFLWFYLFSLIWIYGSAAVGVIIVAALISLGGALGVVVGAVALLAFYVSLFVINFQNLALFTRRMHDVNRSGWWFLLAFTGIGSIVLIYWALRAGDKGANQYGEKAA
jgi:uncharacterized membrane protein YhaH (DUF805 family)